MGRHWVNVVRVCIWNLWHDGLCAMFQKEVPFWNPKIQYIYLWYHDMMYIFLIRTYQEWKKATHFDIRYDCLKCPFKHNQKYKPSQRPLGLTSCSCPLCLVWYLLVSPFPFRCFFLVALPRSLPCLLFSLWLLRLQMPLALCLWFCYAWYVHQTLHFSVCWEHVLP